MRAFSLLLLWISLLPAVLGLAMRVVTPVEESVSNQESKEVRRDGGLYCNNAPSTVAGSLYIPKRRSLESGRLTPRAGNGAISNWCVPNTPDYVRAIIVQKTYSAAAITLLADAWDVVQTTINELHDGVIQPGGFRWQDNSGNGLYITIWSGNRSQMTWGQVALAIGTLRNMFSARGGGTARFYIYSGTAMIGSGLIATGRPNGGWSKPKTKS